MDNDLKQKIFDLLVGSDNAFKTAIGGRLYYFENTDTTITYPYVVYQVVSGDLDRDSGTKYEDVVIQFSIYSNNLSSSEVNDIGKELDDLFNECENNLSLTNWYVLSVDRITVPREIRTLLNNWQWSADYKIQLQKK